MMAIFGLGNQVDQIQEAIESGDPAEIAVRFVQLICMLFGLTSQCFTGDTLVATEDGDVLHTQAGETETVAGVQTEYLDEAVKVYNLEIEDSHTYYVSADGVLVHNRCKLGENMKKEAPFGVGDPGEGYEAHHIFPQKFRDFFESLNIDIDAAEFGIWLPVSEHRSSAKAYNKKWKTQIDIWLEQDNFDVEEVFEFLNTLDRLW